MAAARKRMRSGRLEVSKARNMVYGEEGKPILCHVHIQKRINLCSSTCHTLLSDGTRAREHSHPHI